MFVLSASLFHATHSGQCNPKNTIYIPEVVCCTLSKKRIKKQMPIALTAGRIATLLVAVSLVHSCTEQQLETISMRPAPKMILIIGDGMDDQQITIARNYLSGNNGRLKLDELPYRGVVQVQAVDEDNPSQAVYVTDSASTATAMATGRITSGNRIATSAGTDERLLSIMEIAQSAGLGTGIVTTASLTDATPAAFATHINSRFCQGPADMVSTIGATRLPVNCSQYFQKNGGGGSISEQISALEIDILLGGGTQYFDQIGEGNSAMSVMGAATANGYKVIRKREELALIEADTKVLGLFAPSTMPVRLRGMGGAEAEKIKRINGQVR
ncbi:MAG: alkaline phosphatase, partial [Proteobacteria bacterium]|nr:alkaline phosphatase [Pseudomonadota bacterium]